MAKTFDTGALRQFAQNAEDRGDLSTSGWCFRCATEIERLQLDNSRLRKAPGETADAPPA